MKPDWKDAPPWASYLAQDEGGEWYWYEVSPKLEEDDDNYWNNVSGTRYSLIHEYNPPNPDWRSTLEARPQQQD